LTCEEILERVVDPVARKYLKIAVHSDLATEPHLTNGLNGLKNFVMDLPGYIQQYSIVGGMEMLPRRLRESLSETRVVLGAAVRRVEETRSGTYRITFLRGSRIVREDFDAVFIALPHYHLHSVEWVGENLRRAMARHIAYYDRPAHYLRISMLFRRPFWRKILTGSWFMLDAFGGCCVYDEGTRHEIGGYGVLSWLLAGTDALSHANLDDTSLIDLALGSLPEGLAGASRESLIEAKVHRWLASVNALPGGFPVRDPKSAHQPDARNCPGVFIVGDYLLDSTLNGVTDSANIATDLLGSERDMCRLERPGESRTPAVARSSEGEFQGAALAC
jgi:hypothetical protein